MKKNKRAKYVVSMITIILFTVITFMFSDFNPLKGKYTGFFYEFLPHLNAIINFSTLFLLLSAFLAIRQRKVRLHRKLIIGTMILSTWFLVNYVIYHITQEHTIFGDINENGILEDVEKAVLPLGLRIIYYFTLFSHILTCIILTPTVLYAFYLGYTFQRRQHKKMIVWVFPLWIYISISGLIVYFLISPYY